LNIIFVVSSRLIFSRGYPRQAVPTRALSHALDAGGRAGRVLNNLGTDIAAIKQRLGCTCGGCLALAQHTLQRETAGTTAS
jgi:hypothetical protein